MPDPVIMNDLAGQAILEERHEDAAAWLRAAAECVETTEAKRVLYERAQEQARLGFEKRLARDLALIDAPWVDIDGRRRIQIRPFIIPEP